MVRFLFLLVTCNLLLVAAACADDEPLWDEVQRRAKSKAFGIGSLVQVVGTYERDAEDVRNGFVLANFRLSLRGELDGGWGYFFQTSFIRSPAVLDAALSFRGLHPLAELRFGAFKAPFSAEFLIPASSIDFVNRSQAVTLLVPGRQLGLQLGGKAESGFGYRIGVFNGNGLAIVNDDNDVMSAARVFVARSVGKRSVDFGVNAYHSKDTNAPIGVPITGDFIAEGFGGERVAAGVDFRLTDSRGFVAAEWIGARYDPRGGRRVEPHGYHVTAAVNPAPKLQLLARWDSLRLDGAREDSDQVLLGMNYWPTSPTELQVNVVFPTTGDHDPQVLVNLQVAL